jgi:hypothetical protein
MWISKYIDPLKTNIINEANRNYKISKMKRIQPSIKDIDQDGSLWNVRIENNYKHKFQMFNEAKIKPKTNKSEKLKQYHVKFENPKTGLIFYKVGITKNSVYYRFKHLEDYSITLLDMIEGDNREIRDLEKIILLAEAKNKFIPPEKFGGWTECLEKPIVFL